MLNDGQHSEQSSYDKGGPRSRRHLASFAASIAAHAAIAGLIVCFASPLARGHSEWVLAYLVEMGDGASGRGGARAAASGAPSIHAGSIAHEVPASVSVDRRARKRAAVRKARRRIEDAPSEVASLAPLRSAAPAQPSDSAKREPGAASGAAPGSRSGSGDDDRVATAAGLGGGGAGAGGDAAGGDGTPNSIAHADYASNPRPAYPAIARRRGQQGTVTVRVLVGADGSVERAEVADSSGFDALDDAALETVRSRWRFVPARHDGLAVESWVLVPIRFALLEANAVR